MIAALRGEVIHIGLDHGVIDCAGVGYKFLATPKTLGTLRRGEQATVCLLYTSPSPRDS